MDPALVEMCTHTVKIAPPVGVDAWGQVTYGPDVTYRCWASRRQQLVRSDTGEEVISTLQLYLPDAPDIDPQSRVEFQGRPAALLAANRHDDEHGRPYVTVLFTGPATAGPVRGVR